MRTQNPNSYIKRFFHELVIYEDKGNGKNYKAKIFKSIKKFLKKPTEENAYGVYQNFFEAYWIGIQSNQNPFLELLEMMKDFEKNAGKLLANQRDHYIHSVYVFLLGISIYTGNDVFKKIFINKILDKSVYPDSYPTAHEEFFYRWGIAALFHDIAYPVEITLKQMIQYTSFLCSYPTSDPSVFKIKMVIDDFEKFTTFPTLKPLPKYSAEYYRKYRHIKDNKEAVQLLANNLHQSLNLDYNSIKVALEDFFKKMNNEGFIDHGFFSSIIVLRWYYYLIKDTNWHPAYFYFPVVDAASAILLHNYYPRELMKPPFNLKQLEPELHPVGYLLILCDKLQEWNRPEYHLEAESSYIGYEIYVTDNVFRLKYKMKKVPKAQHDDFLNTKKNDLNQYLNLQELFNKEFSLK